MSQVIGVKELEQDYANRVADLKNIVLEEDMHKRLQIQVDMSQDFGRLVRRMDLVVAKKYQASRKIVYGIENEIHLVEQVQKLLSIMMKISPENLTKKDLIEFILRLTPTPNASYVNSETFRNSYCPKELRLSN